MKRKKKKVRSYYGFTLVVALTVGFGVFVMMSRSSFLSSRPSVWEYTSPIFSRDQTRQPPTEVYIPAIGKRLPVQAAIVVGNQWDLFDNAVAWLSTSAVPGQGNVILYAHDTPPLWGDLYKLKPGDTIEVSQNTTKTIYKVTESRSIHPTDIEAILSKENRLTMYTCEGTFDQKRRVVYAKPQFQD